MTIRRHKYELEKKTNMSLWQYDDTITSYMFKYIYVASYDGIHKLSWPFKHWTGTIPEREICTYVDRAFVDHLISIISQFQISFTNQSED